MAVPPSLLPSHSEKVLGAMKAERTVKSITFNPTNANPGETLYVSVPKLANNEVIVPGSLALVFDINLKVTGAHANNHLVQNVSRALVKKFIVKFASTIIQETMEYGIYKTFEDLFLSKDERENMLREGIQDTDLNKLRSDAGNKDFFFFVICFICFYYTLHCLQNIGYNICITLITIHTYTYNNFFFFFTRLHCI